ncbi:SDR family NAD(P)-dependent oxidoreductase [Paraburkholderia sp. WSM4174]|uniref:SDR family NAD(P)-dependent oxidoreductase n=1 Tax=Paraburkholderia sp. WSM4174 TaxID=2991071 RepID=UPI003D237990
MFSETQIGAHLAKRFNLAGKTAVVTGSAQGLGREIARLLAEAGAKVVIADLNPDAASATASDIDADGGIAMPCKVDVADEASVKALFAAVDTKFGGVDILIKQRGAPFEGRIL